MKKKWLFPSHAFYWCKLNKQTSINRHEAQPSPNACQLLSWSLLLFLSPTYSKTTLCTWISHSFIKIIPSFLSKLTSHVFLPLRIHSVCPPAPSATPLHLIFLFLSSILGLNYFLLRVEILLSMLLWRKCFMFRNAELGEYKPRRKYFQILFWNFNCNFAVG